MPNTFDIRLRSSGVHVLRVLGALSRSVAAFSLCAVALLIVACSSAGPAVGSKPGAGETKPVPLTAVPELRGKTLRQANGLLGSEEVTVVVTFPSVNATDSVGEQNVAGSVIPAHKVRISHVGKKMSLAAAVAKGPTYVVLSQSPLPGEPIAGLSAIEIKTDEHPSNKTGFTWITSHPKQVQSEGASPCFDCHPETDCSGCHTKVSQGY